MVWWGLLELRKPGPLTENKIIMIERGKSVGLIAETLSYNRVIEHYALFVVAARLSGAHKKLQAGEYEFPAEISAREVLNLLASGKTYQRHITIPEGLTSAEIVALLNAEPALSGAIETLPPEGSLLPETYNFSYGDDRAQKIKQMQDAMEKTLRNLCDTGRCAPPQPIGPGDDVILASIVEKETAVESERARVAGVFYNRLRAGMPLQSDPTVIYALTKGLSSLDRALTRMDIESTDSPYNTYKYPGLPPGPIANPGRASLEAVYTPEFHDFFYFVADGTGGHAFAKTLEEHNQNVTKWRKIQKNPPAAPPAP